MSAAQQAQAILQELSYSLSRISEEQASQFAEAILRARRVYAVGAGRSLMMLRCFAMRLMQLGFTSYVAGETITPAIGPGDLLVIGSGSGETGTLKIMAQKAKAAGAELALITAHPESTLGKMSNLLVTIAAPTVKNAGGSDFVTVQPGASMFEQTLLLFGDMMVLELQRLQGVQDKNEPMNRLHTNLE